MNPMSGQSKRSNDHEKKRQNVCLTECWPKGTLSAARRSLIYFNYEMFMETVFSKFTTKFVIIDKTVFVLSQTAILHFFSWSLDRPF